MKLLGIPKHYSYCGMFSSKKTYVGVGSAVQNLMAEKLDNNLNTLTVSAQQNQTELGEAFKNFLANGSGLKLRSVIDYAHQKGYTDTLGWKVSELTGQVFSDATAYDNYLSTYVYPTEASTTTTPETTVSETVTHNVAYHIGNDEFTEKTTHIIKSKTITTTNTIHSFTNEVYYQGTHSEFLAMNNLLTSSAYDNLSDYAKDTGLLISGDISVLCENHNTGYFKNFSNLVLLLVSPKVTKTTTSSGFTRRTYETVPTTVDGTLIAAQKETLDKPCMYTHEQYGNDWNDESYSTEYTFKTVVTMYQNNFGYYFWRDNNTAMRDPVTTLDLNNNVPNICKLEYILSFKNYLVDEDDERHSSSHDTYATDLVWWKGYGLIVPYDNSTEKVLVAHINVHKTVEKLTSVVNTEYVVTEKYINGKLVSTSTVEGAKTSSNTSETLEDKTFSHIESYKYGSGNSKLDIIIDNTKDITEQFMPIMPIKLWGEMCSSSWGDLYTAERKLYKKITSKNLSKWDEFVESFKDVGDDAKLIYYFPAIPINVDHEFANEYFFHFFKWLAVNYNGMNYFGTTLTFGLKAAKADFNVGYTFKVTYKVVKGTPPVPCKVHNYARYHVIGTGEDNDLVSKSFQKNGIESFYNKMMSRYLTSFHETQAFTGKKEDYPELSDEEFKQLQYINQSTVVTQQDCQVSSITFYYKINESMYEKVFLTNFHFNHIVKDAYLAYYLKNSLQKDWKKAVDENTTNDDNAGFSPIIIPIARGALESMGWYRQSNLLQVCHNVVVAGYQEQTIKTKWYQSGLFLVIVIVVIVIICIFTWGGAAPAAGGAAGSAGGAGAGGAAAAGATVGAATTAITISMIAEQAIQAIACAVIAKVISYAANKYIGGVLGSIVAVVATVIACYYFGYWYNGTFSATTSVATSTTTSLWESMCSWNGFMQICSVAMNESMDYLNRLNQEKIGNFQTYYSNVMSDQEDKTKQMNYWAVQQANWGNNKINNILIDSTYTYASTYKDTIQFSMPEDPDTFYDRITGKYDVYDLTISYIEDMVDLYDTTSKPYPLNLYS